MAKLKKRSIETQSRVSKIRSSGLIAAYEIGRGRPPLHSRWKSGQSGNPSGRPKRSNSFGALLYAGLNKRRRVTSEDHARSISVRDVIVEQVLKEAMTGNLKAIAFVFENALAPPRPPEKFIVRESDPARAADAIRKWIASS